MGLDAEVLERLSGSNVWLPAFNTSLESSPKARLLVRSQRYGASHFRRLNIWLPSGRSNVRVWKLICARPESGAVTLAKA